MNTHIQTAPVPRGLISIEPSAGELSFPDAVKQYAMISGVEIKCQAARAELCSYVESRYGEGSVVKFLDELQAQGIRLGKTQFYSLVRVWREFGEQDANAFSAQAENLSLTHLIKCCHTDDPQGWAEAARVNGWTVSELENSIQMTRSLPSPEKTAHSASNGSESGIQDPARSASARMPTGVEHKTWLGPRELDLLAKGTAKHEIKDGSELIRKALEIAYDDELMHLTLHIDDELIDNIATVREYLAGDSDEAVIRLALQRTARAIEKGGGGLE